MAQKDENKQEITRTHKLETAAQIGSLVLGTILTSVQLFFTIRNNTRLVP